MSAAPRTSTEAESGETVVGPAIAIRGRIEGEEDLRVEGRIEGSISLTETLYVEPGGIVLAQIEARDVVISGIVIGDVSAANCVTLNKNAKLIGNISAPRVIIADGASFRGDVVMEGDDLQAARERSRATTTAPRSTINHGSRATTTPRRAVASGSRTVSGSYESRDSSRASNSTTTTTARPTAPAPRRETVTAPRERVAPRPAAPPRRTGADAGREEEDVTVVIKHSALRKGEAPPEDDDDPARRRAKKSARMPARGRRKAGRRD
jgi:cytoskeletal protein CcmA (bactofilin family)